jgi:pilus assembly protein CpaB
VDKRTINLIIGVFLGLVAIMMIKNYIDQQKAELERLKLEGELVEVVVARVDIPRETTISRDMITVVNANRNSLQPGDLTFMDSVIGQFAEVDILKGQHINSNMIRSLGSITFLSQGVPRGMRAITIPVDKLTAIEGLIKPQDNVDIVGTFQMPSTGGRTTPVVITIFQNVTILATNRNISPYRISQSIDTVTLALKPEDVKLLTYILNAGKIRLVLRGPLDTSQEHGYSAVDFNVLMQKLGMYVPKPTEKKPTTIDVYRGLEREAEAIDQ